MSYLEVPPFDALEGQMSPYVGFGPPLATDKICEQFEAVISEATSRIRQVFGVEIARNRESVALLDRLVDQMWNQGWDPRTGDIDLFVRDFGSLLTGAIHKVLGGELLFRSPIDMSHASVWWREAKIEVFPFHKMLKRMTYTEGETLIYFFDGLSARLRIARDAL